MVMLRVRQRVRRASVVRLYISKLFWWLLVSLWGWGGEEGELLQAKQGTLFLSRVA